MSIILKHIFRNIRENGFRSILIVFSLALSAAVFYVNLNIRADVYSSSKSILDASYNGYDLRLQGSLEEGKTLLPEIERVLPVKISSAVTEKEDKAVLCQLDLAQAILDGSITISSSMAGFTPKAAYHSVISAEKAEELGYALGDIVAVVTADEEIHPIMITALAEDLGIFAQSDGSVLEVLTDIGDNEPDYCYLALADDDGLSELCDSVNAAASDVSVSQLYQDYKDEGTLQSIRRLLSIILLLIIAISIYVVSSSQSLIIQYRLPVLGTFRSLGATALTTNLVLLFESAMYGLIALVPGLFFGEVLRRLINSAYVGGDTSRIVWYYMLLVLLFTVGLNLLIALLSILRSGRRSIIELIFKKQSSAKKPSVLQGILGLLLFGLSIFLAWENTHYNFYLLLAEMALAVIGAGLAIGPLASWLALLLQRPVWFLFGGPAWLGVRDYSVSRTNRSTSLLVTTVMAMVLMIYVVVSSVTGFFEEYSNNYPYDIMIKFAVGEEEDFSYIEELPGVDSVVYEYWDFNNVCINGEENRACFCAVDGYSNGIEVEEGLFESLQDGETVLDRMYAKVNDFEIGDRLTFVLGSRSFTLRVAGFCDSGIFNSSRITVMMTRADFFSYIEKDPAIIGICTGEEVSEMVTALNEAIYDKTGEVYSVIAKEDYVGDQFNEAMNGMKSISAVPILAIVLALFGMVNNQLVAFNQNRFRYAMLYSTSMSRRQLNSMLLSELVYSFVIGSAAGVGLSLWLSKVVRDIIYVSISYVPLVIEETDILLSFLLLFILLCLTALFPAGRLRKLDIIKEIKYE